MKKITITEKILKRPVTVFMVSLIVIGFGLFSLSNLKVNLLPAFNIPVLAVSVNYSNVSPQDMTRLIVEPIEGALMGVDGIETLEGNVRRGGAFIILRLKEGIDIQQTELKVREAVERVRPFLPAEANEPFIFQFDPDRSPIMELSVESQAMGMDELRQFSIEFIEPRIERLPGVASTDTRGGLERNFYVNLDPDAMASHGVLPNQVVSAIRNNNTNLPIGNIVADRLSYSVRADAVYKSIEEIEQTVVRTTPDGVLIRVSDVAMVENTYADVNSLEEVNGANSVKVDIQKQSDANTLDVAQAVIAEIERFRGSLPGSVNVQILSNEGDFIQKSISNLAQSALIALVVVVLILLFFMGGWRIAFVVAMSIPVSLTFTFAAMYFMDISLNIISITGLALAIGLLVDNSIVVSESIANKLEQGHRRFKAALLGTNEVAGALLGSTLTTLAVFVPILGVTGFTGTITRDLALTISIAITSSYLASIILIPVLASILLRREEFDRKSFTFKGILALEKNYGRILFWILDKKWIIAVFVVAVMAGSFYFYRTIPGEFFPENDSGEFNVRVTLPAGTQLGTTANVLRNFSTQLQQLPEARIVTTSIGRQRRSAEANLGEINVVLVDMGSRNRSTADLIEVATEMLQQPDIDVQIQPRGGGGPGIPTGRGNWGGGGRGITLSMIGPDVEILQEMTARIEERLINDPDVISVTNSRTSPTPEIHFELDMERLNRLGATGNQIASALGTQARGTRAGFLRLEGREIPIEVRNDRDRFVDRSDLIALDVFQDGDIRVPVAAVGEFNVNAGLSRIQRRDREVVLDVSVVVRGTLDEHRDRIEEIIKSDIILPDGYRYDFGGTIRDRDDSFAQMGTAFLIALLLTYMVMASLFENFKDPFIIMFTVPLAFFGSLAFLFILNTPLSVPAYIGIVLLVGIVVNNGIVLVDYIHQNTDRGTLKGKAYMIKFLQACKRRMRPILLTAMTTIFSMIPLALELGAGAETWSPLAKSVIGGLFFSTILTLFVVPAFVIAISKQRREWVKKGMDEII
jgi:HAE1 family hydrophobic/amphiphilic exporter-1